MNSQEGICIKHEEYVGSERGLEVHQDLGDWKENEEEATLKVSRVRRREES